MKMKQLVSLFLALLIFGTRVGFALNVHHCGDQIAEISFAQNPLKCGMEMSQNKASQKERLFSKKACCKDTTLLFQNQEPQTQKNFIDSLLEFQFHDLTQFDLEHKNRNYFHEIRQTLSDWNPPPPPTNLLSLRQALVFYG